VKSTNYEATHVIFSILLLLTPFQVYVVNSAPCSQTHKSSGYCIQSYLGSYEVELLHLGLSTD